MKDTKELLTLATDAFPPDPPRRHGLTLTDSGDLQLVLAINGEFQPIIIFGDDMDKSPTALIDEIKRLLNK